MFKVINFIGLSLKHFLFLLKAIVKTLIENIMINFITVGLALYLHFQTNQSLNFHYMVYGALLSIFLTLNILTAGEQYRKSIVWDGDINIINAEKQNFEFKKSVYYNLCKNLSIVISMIVTYFDRIYAWQVLLSKKDFDEAKKHFSLNRFQNVKFDLSNIDVINSYNTFKKYVDSFYKINEVIVAIEIIQTQINDFCSSTNMKASIAFLINELLITSYNVSVLKDFLSESSVYDDEQIWRTRLWNLYTCKTVNTSIIKNNIRNIVNNLSVIYDDINNDYNFERNK